VGSMLGWLGVPPGWVEWPPLHSTAGTATTVAASRAVPPPMSTRRQRWRTRPPAITRSAFSRSGGSAVIICANASRSSVSSIRLAPSQIRAGGRAGDRAAELAVDRAADHAAQRVQAAGGLALDVAGGAVQQPRGLVHGQVVEEPQHQHRPLTGRD